MKRSLSNSVKSYAKAALVLTVAVLTLSGKSYSQISTDDVTSIVSVKLNKNAVENLKMNISSENPGVKKSAIYYSGYYKVMETLDPLMKQLRYEKDPATRILIALSLYKINDASALKLVKKVSDTDADAKVRRMCSAIYSEYSNGQSRVAAR